MRQGTDATYIVPEKTQRNQGQGVSCLKFAKRSKIEVKLLLSSREEERILILCHNERNATIMVRTSKNETKSRIGCKTCVNLAYKISNTKRNCFYLYGKKRRRNATFIVPTETKRSQ